MNVEKFKYQKFTTGFTIIEILIIVAIIGIMATMSVTNFQAGREDEALRIGALRIAEGLRSAQNYAQSGTHQTYAAANAYGVYIKKPDTIVVFADTSCPKDESNACLPDTLGEWEEASDKKISDITLAVDSKKSISIDAVNGISVDGVNADEAHIGFRALNGMGMEK